MYGDWAGASPASIPATGASFLAIVSRQLPLDWVQALQIGGELTKNNRYWCEKREGTSIAARCLPCSPSSEFFFWSSLVKGEHFTTFARLTLVTFLQPRSLTNLSSEI